MNASQKRIGAIVLAAGASTRLGRPKQLLVLNGETLLARAVRIASNACELVVVVLGANAELVKHGCDLGETTVVMNEAWREGMGSSIRAGINVLDGCDGAVLMTCDMPAVTTHHLQRLIQADAIAASLYAERRGVPAFFPSAIFPELLCLKGDRGAQSLLQEAQVIELASGEIDVDTIDDFERAKTCWPSRTL